MSGFKSRRGAGEGGPPRGLFANGVWHCDCDPRTPAVHFQVKKPGPNKGKWFRTCQKKQEDKNRCSFFLWDHDAHGREAAALANNSRTESGPASSPANPSTPSRRQYSPPPPSSLPTRAADPSRKRTHSIVDLGNDDYGAAQTDNAFNNELDQVMAQVETPNKAIKTNNFATPSTTRRKLPWHMDQASASSPYRVQTPQTNHANSNNPFAPRNLTPVRVGEEESQHIATPSSLAETPTPSRFKDAVADDLNKNVFGVLNEYGVQLPDHIIAALANVLSQYARSAEGYRRGRDVTRTTVKAKEAKITELTYRVSTLEAELEAEKALVKHLQWKAQDDSSEP